MSTFRLFGTAKHLRKFKFMLFLIFLFFNLSKQVRLFLILILFIKAQESLIINNKKEIMHLFQAALVLP